MDIRIAGYANDSIVDGPGIRFTLFVQGCPHHCEGCHNPQTHDFAGGYVVSTEEIYKRVAANPLLDGVTFSGGEPFCQAHALYVLGSRLREQYYGLIVYTGYTFEYLIKNATSQNFYRELLSIADYLIDGRFDISKKNYLLRFRGSENQRILDCATSLKCGYPVISEFSEY